MVPSEKVIWDFGFGISDLRKNVCKIRNPKSQFPNLLHYQAILQFATARQAPGARHARHHMCRVCRASLGADAPAFEVACERFPSNCLANRRAGASALKSLTHPTALAQRHLARARAIRSSYRFANRTPGASALKGLTHPTVLAQRHLAPARAIRSSYRFANRTPGASALKGLTHPTVRNSLARRCCKSASRGPCKPRSIRPEIPATIVDRPTATTPPNRPAADAY